MSLYFDANSFFMAQSLIADKAFAFSVRIVKIHLHLCATNKDVYSISKQLLRSATSIGANVEEALGGHTEKDFAAKMSIAYKEGRETKYWLRLLKECKIVDEDNCNACLIDVEEILRMIGSVLKTVKKKLLQTPNS